VVGIEGKAICIHNIKWLEWNCFVFRQNASSAISIMFYVSPQLVQNDGYQSQYFSLWL